MPKETKVLTVDGMSCSHCENRIIKSVGNLTGVESVSVDLDTQKVTISFEPENVSIDTIREMIEDQGYDIK